MTVSLGLVLFTVAVASLVGPLAVALDIIAGGSLSIDGDVTSPVLTRQDLLDQLAAYVA